MQSIASNAMLANLFKLLGAKKEGFFLNCAKSSLIDLCWMSQRSTLLVDFKLESVLQSRRKKTKFYI